MTRLSVQGSNGINPFVNAVHRKSPFGFPAAQDQPIFYVAVYAAIGLAAGVVNILQDLTQYFGAVRSVVQTDTSYNLLILVTERPVCYSADC